ncbi:MAG: signal peptidase I [Spirochaetales bacterium]
MKTRRIMKIVGNTLIWIIFALSLLTVILSLSTTEGVPNIFGVGYLSVQTDSMEPVFGPGDLIFVETTSPTDQFEIDDIVTFRTIIEGEQVLNTHRIISYATIAGVRYYSTQGDNVNQSDLATITSGDIVAKYIGIKLNGFGSIVDYIQSSTGFLICIVLPLAAIFIYQIVNFIMLLSKYKESDKKVVAGLESLTEEEKQELAKKYLESLEQKKKDN